MSCKITIQDLKSSKQYERKKNIATTIKIVRETGHNHLKHIFDDIANNTVVKRLELENVPDLFPVNKSLIELTIRNETIFIEKTIRMFSNLKSLCLECDRIIKYEPFYELNYLTNLRHLYLNVKGSYDCPNVRLTNLSSLTLLGTNVDYHSFVKLAKNNYNTLIISIDIQYFTQDAKYDGCNGLYINNFSNSLKCLKLVDRNIRRLLNNPIDYKPLMSILIGSDITYFDLVCNRPIIGYDKLIECVNSRWLKNTKCCHNEILEIYLIFVKYLPPYVALEVFDWLPLFIKVSHVYKIKTIQSIYNSYKKIKLLFT